MNTAEEIKFEELERCLESHAFVYKGCGMWQDAVTALTYPTSQAYIILRQRLYSLWTRDNLGDYNITIDRRNEDIPIVIGKIIKCHNTSDNERWLLLVNNINYGFYKSCKQAKKRFDKDCMPKGKAGDDHDSEYYCWHKTPIGPGPYCTGCGGLFKPKGV
jgi:hypothetical protein